MQSGTAITKHGVTRKDKKRLKGLKDTGVY